MNDRQLHYILAIAKEGNLTAAAQKLFISQPSLSGMLAHMEEELGVKLFDRGVSPMILTYAGEQFVRSAEEILTIYHDLQHRLDDISEANTGRLNIGCGPRLSPYIIPRILPPFMRRYPDVQVNLYEYDRAVLEQKLVSGNLDLVFTTMSLPQNKSIDYIRLYNEETMLITPRSFQPEYDQATDSEGRKVVRLESLSNQAFVLLKPGHQMRKLIDQLFLEAGIAPVIVLETDSAETCLRLVECGIACTILPVGARLIPENNLLNLCSIRPSRDRQLCICSRKSGYQSKINKLFIDLSVELLGRNDIPEKNRSSGVRGA